MFLLPVTILSPNKHTRAGTCTCTQRQWRNKPHLLPRCQPGTCAADHPGGLPESTRPPPSQGRGHGLPQRWRPGKAREPGMPGAVLGVGFVGVGRGGQAGGAGSLAWLTLSHTGSKHCQGGKDASPMPWQSLAFIAPSACFRPGPVGPSPHPPPPHLQLQRPVLRGRKAHNQRRRVIVGPLAQRTGGRDVKSEWLVTGPALPFTRGTATAAQEGGVRGQGRLVRACYATQN